MSIVSGLIKTGWCGVVLCSLALPGWAQYKVVGPDGKITYTDKPPAVAPTRVAAPGAAASGAAPAAASADLPYELQQLQARYPVSLYSVTGCAPCDAGRALLRQRGIPFQEWTLDTAQDLAEFNRRESTSQMPVLRVGQQRLVGWDEQDWQSTLDAAGYPKQSKLPARWRAPAAQPLVSSRPASSPGAAARATVPVSPQWQSFPVAPQGPRF